MIQENTQIFEKQIVGKQSRQVQTQKTKEMLPGLLHKYPKDCLHEILHDFLEMQIANIPEVIFKSGMFRSQI